ncbi:hypothetical protein MUGA111182_15360 [Mucilaginibacter galii]|uniref:Uncharacterized protein n=1 Tax=Mucilaginibacter galii TaxID=2005073 RepID=A0A917N349_9SPHI|nr:hypothetical protein [Mucilaginibacter galii]GGI52551.1 hypothetical protein GCM10011425_37630 [Mucilaginibacter galii]
MKKQRGLKRYYSNLGLQNDFKEMTWLNFDCPEIWFDNWHIHFDWKGYGNNSFNKRKPHLDKLFRHFSLLVNMTHRIKSDFQLYAIIYDIDSSDDALCIHTPNPNNSPFPLEIEELSKASTLNNKPLNLYVKNLEGYEKLYGQTQYEAYCLLYIKGIGKPF